MCAWYRIQTRIEFTLTHKQTNPLTHTPFIVCDGCICSKVRIVRKKRHVTQLHLQTPECIGMNKTQWKCSTTTLNTCKNAWIPTCRSVARSVSMRFTQNIHINNFFSVFFRVFVCLFDESCSGSYCGRHSVWINLCKHWNYVVGFELSTCLGVCCRSVNSLKRILKFRCLRAL